MPIKKYTPEDMIKLLRLVEIETGQGMTPAQACRGLGFTEQSYYRWRKEYGGLKISQAANQLNLVPSAVSRKITELEKYLGVRLLQRTTRSVSLTEEGKRYLHKM